MPDNTIVSAAVGVGATLVLREIAHSGDTALLPGSFLMGISGSEGAYTVGAINGDATNGLDVDVTRCASHDVTNAGTFATQITGDALTSLQLIDNAVSGAGFNITQFAGATVPIGAGVEATALRVTIASDSTGVLSIDDNGGSITVDGTVSVSDSVTVANAGTFAVQAAQSGTWTVDLGATDNAVLDAIAASLAGTLTVASHAVTNAGTFAVQAAQSGTWNIGTVTAVTGITNALPAGTNAIGKLAANSGVDIGDVDVTSISAGTNLIGDVGLSGARTSGGATLFSNNGTSTKTQIKATAGQIYWLHCINLNATVVYLQIFNLASASVTLGTTVPDLQFPVPTAGSTNGAGFNLPIPNGQAFSTGITYAITTTKGGATAATADTAFLNGGYA